MTSALRWAAMRAILVFHNCEGQSHKTASTDHSFWRERRAEADSNRSRSAYHPNALPLGHTGSLQLRGTAEALFTTLKSEMTVHTKMEIALEIMCVGPCRSFSKGTPSRVERGHLFQPCKVCLWRSCSSRKCASLWWRCASLGLGCVFVGCVFVVSSA